MVCWSFDVIRKNKIANATLEVQRMLQGVDQTNEGQYAQEVWECHEKRGVCRTKDVKYKCSGDTRMRETKQEMYGLVE